MAALRIGLFGGSFDPPHLGHLALARAALDALHLDELRWLPAGAPWQKAGRAMAEPQHRSAMVALLLAGEPRFALDPRELERQGPSYTIDTVRELRHHAQHAQLLLVIGQDQYAKLHTWRAWRELVGAVTLAVAAREGHAPHAAAELHAVPHALQVLPMPRIDVSATDIRARVRKGLDIASLVGEPVARYIARNHLYRSEQRP
jgi:nicotinate-nucleotide adenylyltransferase